MTAATNPKAEWQLRLYVAGQTAKSITALENLKRLCETHLAGRYQIEVVDLLVNPNYGGKSTTFILRTDDAQAAAKLNDLAGQSITLFDATVAVLAERLQMEVWTYDHHFDVMQASVWHQS